MQSKTQCAVSPGRSVIRRDLLKGGVVAAAGTVLAGVQVPWVHAAEDNTLRLALIGCGGRGRGAVANAMHAPGGPVKLYAMADIFEDRLKAAYDILAKQFGERVDVPPERRTVGFDAYRQAIDSLRPGDIALLTAYAYCRPAQLEYAVQKGVHVFMEKSFAPDPGGIQRMLAAGEAAKQKNLKIAAGLMCRHSPARQALIEKIRAGELGEIPLVKATRRCPGSGLGKPAANTDLVIWQIRNQIHFLWVSSGGMIEYLIHQIDECCWVKDGWPVSARGTGTPANNPHNCSQNFDLYQIEYTFADGGKAVVESRGEFATYVFGSKHAAQFSGDVHRPTVRIFKGREVDPNQIIWSGPKEQFSPWDAEWHVLLDAIRNDKPHNETQRAMYANLVAIMGRAAVHMGRPITWDEMLKSKFVFCPYIDELKPGGPAPVQPDAEGRWPVPIPGQWTEI